jgi:hypothetical protein
MYAIVLIVLYEDIHQTFASSEIKPQAREKKNIQVLLVEHF